MRSRSWNRGAAAAFLAALSAFSLPQGAAAQQMLSLDDALSLAMKNSPDIRHTRFQLEASEARLRSQQASLKTQFGLTLGPISYVNRNQFDEFFSTWYRYESKNVAGQLSVQQPIKWTDGVLSLNNRFSWQDSYSQATGGESSKNYRNELYLQFDQPLFTYNRMKMDLGELELDFESSQLTYAIALLELERSVMNAFYSLYETKMRLEINYDALETDREHHRIMQNKYDAGIGKLDDLTQAETDMLSSEATWNDTKVSLANALDRFKYLIGIPIDDDIDIATDITFSPVGVDMDFAVKHGLETRMELRSQEISIAEAYNNVVRAGTTNEFRGDLSLVWGSSGTNPDLQNIYDKRVDEQSVSVSFDIPIWDWGQKKNNIRASEIGYESEKLRLEENRTGIIMDIRESCRALDNLVQQIEIARRRVESAEKTYEINLEKYQNGDLTSQLLGDYRQTLSNAKLSQIRTLIEYKLQLLDLKIQTLWDFENDRPVVTLTAQDSNKE
jgi:outer membrane protein